METDSSNRVIGVVDYIVFTLMLAFSAATGFFYAFKDRNENNMDNFHRGKRKINPLAATLSISVTVVSAIAIIGLSAEVYIYGTMIIWEGLGVFLASGIGAHVFIPIFYNMDKISIFEYFQERFGKVARFISSVCYLINTFITMSFTLYAPCLAFEAMTAVSFWIAMVVTGFVCVTYTLLGGMKAVVWADTLQFCVIIAGLICTLIAGSNAVGGFGSAWGIAYKLKRIEFFNFSFDPRTRHSVWNVAIGFAITWLSAGVTNQAVVQRACSLSSLRAAKLSMWASFPGLFLILLLTVLNGVVMFAYYNTCDPIKMGRVSKKDQLFPLMVVELIGHIPGLPGLLMASLFSGALSTVSSGLNAVSAVLIEDIIIPYSHKPLSDRKQLVLSKVTVVATSVICIGIAGGISRLSGTINQLLLTVSSVINGPLLGIFVAGILFPWTNTYGVCVGIIVALGLSGWLVFGSLINSSPSTPLPVSTEGCFSNTTMLPFNNSTQTTQSVITSTVNDMGGISTNYSAVEEFYRMSYMWYAAFGMAMCVTVALIISFITRAKYPKDVNRKLMFPLFYTICVFLPMKHRKLLRFGVDYEEKDVKEKTASENMYAINGNTIEKTAGYQSENSHVLSTHM